MQYVLREAATAQCFVFHHVLKSVKATVIREHRKLVGNDLMNEEKGGGCTEAAE